jgi:tetratricopeptide (TPR) repeat protein
MQAMILMRSLIAAMLAFGMAHAAWAQSGMTPEQAYVRAVSYMQVQLNRIDTDNRIHQAKATGERLAMRAELDAALKELASLRADASKSKAAAAALQAFAADDAAGGLDALEAEAKTKSAAALKDWKRVGALAFAVDSQRAVRAYQEALKLAPDDTETLSRLGLLYARLGNIGEARALAEKLAVSADPAIKARGLINLGRMRLSQDQPQFADAFGRQAGEAARAAKSEALQAEALFLQGSAAEAQGHWGQAEGFQTAALRGFVALGDEVGQAESLVRLAAVARLRNSWGISDARLREAFAIYEKRNDQIGLTQVSLGLGETAMVRNSAVEATGWFYRAQRGFQMLGDRAGQADAQKGLGDAAAARGSMPEACLNWRGSRALYAQLGASVGAPAQEIDKNLREKCR